MAGFVERVGPMIGKVVSGGQTGVDRAALDFAVAHDLAYGGWCPKGGWAEDLQKPPGLLERYPALTETPSADPAQRTVWNVRDSDATLIVVGPGLVQGSPGSALAEETARRLGRLHATVRVDDESRRHRVVELLRQIAPEAILNVAGPRESESPGIYRACLDMLGALADVFGLGPT